MIQLTLIDGRKHLFNPDLIQETGAYFCNGSGVAIHLGAGVDASGFDQRNFVVMQACEPLDIVDEPAAVALLREAWKMRSEMSPFSLTSYVMIDEDGAVAFMGISA